MTKVLLAYSGGLDTSVILCWLRNELKHDVHVFIADVGQQDNFQQTIERALSLGIAREKIFVRDLKDELVDDFYCKAAKANVCYETYYLMGTPIARPCIARAQVRTARAVGATHLAHGCTQKGNDQLRFELAYCALAPDLEVIAPWRIWSLRGRSDLVRYAQQNGIHWIRQDSYSRDENLLHLTAEGLELEDPGNAPSPAAWGWTTSPQHAPDQVTRVTISFDHGTPCALNGVPERPRTIIEELNRLGAANGIGRLDVVDNRFTSIKSRGLYESPGATIWTRAHRALESITLTREQLHLSNELSARYSTNIYNGMWFAPEMEALASFFDVTQKRVTGNVRLDLYKGNMILAGIDSPFSLFDSATSSFDSDVGITGADATGFIRMVSNGLRAYGPVPDRGESKP